MQLSKTNERTHF